MELGNNLVCIGGNDDTTVTGCTTGGESQVVFNACVGTTYYFLVGGFGGATGTFSITVSAPVVIPTPTCPTLSVPAANATGVAVLPSFSFTAGAGATSYNLYIANTGSATCPGIVRYDRLHYMGLQQI
ncbi:MAG: hypothetical protein IPN89_04575 [Saprospiraceae bacterium]|nr:hypothetical protein [Saprospiraceae bacterium]